MTITRKDFRLFADLIAMTENETTRQEQINFIMPVLMASNVAFSKNRFIDYINEKVKKNEYKKTNR